MMLAELRVRTRAQHHQLELDLDLLRPDLTLPEYVLLLQRLFALYAPLERAVAADIPPVWAARLGLEARLKTGWLRADLMRLQGVWSDLASRAAAPVQAVPGPHPEAAAWGTLYVLEGATLGGQIICRSLGDRLGLSPETGLRFYTSYGEQVGPRWKAFCAALEERAGQEAGDRATAFVEAAVYGAQSAFAAFSAEVVPALGRSGPGDREVHATRPGHPVSA